MVLAVIVIIICAFEVLTKGWYTFLLFPTSFAIFALEFMLQFFANKMYQQDKSRFDLQLIRYVQLGTFLAFYITVIGIGDTEKVLLFGFLDSTVDSGITKMSDILNISAIIATIIMTVYLLTRIILLRRKMRLTKTGGK